MSLAQLHQKAPGNLKSSESAGQLSSLKLAQIEKSISERAMVVEGLHGKKNSLSRPLKSNSSSVSSSHTKLRTNSASNEVRFTVHNLCAQLFRCSGPLSVYGNLIHFPG